MKTSLVLLVPLCALAACSDPLEKFAKLSDVELADVTPSRGALASPEEIARDKPVLASLMASKDSEESQAESVELERKDGAKSTPETPSALAVASLDPLKISDESGVGPSAEPLVAPETAALITVSGPETAFPVTNGSTKIESGRRPNLLGFLRKPKSNKTEIVAPDVEVAALVVTDAQPEQPTVDLQAPLAEDAPTASDRAGLGGQKFLGPRKKRERKGPDAQDVTAGTVVPYGTVVRVCDVKSNDLGKRVEKAGVGKGYSLYDSVPDSTNPRTFYVTGFADGCARQFTAALALFGAPTLHEQLRYGRPASQYPYSTTDKAYELVKSSICGVAKRKPCGSKISRLEKDTVFISTYERFTDNGRWADILIHDGRVLAAAIKDL